jgi:hypothetical protein
MAVRVSIPELPPAWSGADGWELDWRSLETIGATCLAEPGETLILFLPRTSFAAIRCRPVFGSSRGHPYGAIWPLDTCPAANVQGGVPVLETGQAALLELQPGGGLAAELAFRLYQGGWDAANFNLRRFSVEAERRMADPWNSDLAILARAVAEGRFRADYFRTPDKTSVGVSSLPGTMVSGSPWGTIVLPDPQGKAVLSVSPGIHRWFGHAQELIVSVLSDGTSAWMLRGTDGKHMQNVLP